MAGVHRQKCSLLGSRWVSAALSIVSFDKMLDANHGYERCHSPEYQRRVAILRCLQKISENLVEHSEICSAWAWNVHGLVQQGAAGLLGSIHVAYT